MGRKGLISGLAVVAATTLSLGIFAANAYIDHRSPNFKDTKVLYVYPDTPVREISDSLKSVVIRPRSLARAFRKELGDRKIRPGRYQVDPSVSSVYLARMLANGWETPGKLVLSGTMRAKGAIARKISNQMMLDSATVMQALCDRSLLAEYGFTPENVFSLIIPDTYEVYWTASVRDILDVQKKAYDSFWTDERKSKAKAQGLSPMEVSILASIVKGESNYEPEYPKIAGVYLNRLHTGMKLQADPTVAWCFGYKINRVLKKHLEYDSPYNTYLYAGLPPGPIYVPTKACLEAVLNPDRHGYLYFCASPDFNGTHRFAATYSEHLANARAFQRALDANRAAKNN